ncbi:MULTISPECIES: response regulator [unclassified Psychrobacter]|jgi:nucleoside phosphorylase|uniref:phosphorylase family protein n=1 Tax=unclassified Psychrobacter TaxID=196806 RepID=UPI0025E5D434|nr:MULTISPECIES: response regulator [unclassified Psychrobacter]
MKILILEDDTSKLERIRSFINSVDFDISLEESSNYNSFYKQILTHKYDLILMDLLVPHFDGDEPKDLSKELMKAVRDESCMNSTTNVIALTKFQDKAIAHSNDLNTKDITVITFSDDNNWHEPIIRYISKNMSLPKYDFVIICALEKETLAFAKLDCSLTENKPVRGLDCRELKINDFRGMIITCPRMGLVDAAITSSRAIEIFQPNLICMSGICAGIKDEVNIYDLVIPDVCYQHDSGKWTVEGLTSEPYSVQLDNEVSLRLKSIINVNNFNNSLMDGITLKRSQIPEHLESIDLKTILGVASSGSTVVADNEMSKNVSNQHRKVISFDMENYSVYEAARLANSSPIFFSIKSVVDNGNDEKSDKYQELACEIAAKATLRIIESIL